MRWCAVLSDCGLSAEEVEGHGGEERWDALLVMQMKSHHLSQSFGELCFHKLHASVGALNQNRTHNNKQSDPLHLLPHKKKTFKVKQAHLKVVILYKELVCECVCIHSRVKVSKSVWIN